MAQRSLQTLKNSEMRTYQKEMLLRYLENYLNVIKGGYNIEGEDVEALETEIESLKRELNSFVVTSVHKDDLHNVGLIAKEVSSENMERLASKLSDDYCEQLFHTSLKIIAEDGFEIPTWESYRDYFQGLVKDMLDDPEIVGQERLDLEDTLPIINTLESKLENNNVNADAVEVALLKIEKSLKLLNDKAWLEEFIPKFVSFMEFINFKASNND